MRTDEDTIQRTAESGKLRDTVLTMKASGGTMARVEHCRECNEFNGHKNGCVTNNTHRQRILEGLRDMYDSGVGIHEDPELGSIIACPECNGSQGEYIGADLFNACPACHGSGEYEVPAGDLGREVASFNWKKRTITF